MSSYPAHGRPTTIEQADHHIFCQPCDILIRLFKIHIQKPDHNSWWLISVDLPFLYFLGEKSTPVVWKMHTVDCRQCLFSVLKDADLSQMLMYIRMLEILYTPIGVKVLMLLKYARDGWGQLGNAPTLLAQVQSVNKHKIAFFTFRYNFIKTSLYSFRVVVVWREKACILNLKAEEIKWMLIPLTRFWLQTWLLLKMKKIFCVFPVVLSGSFN